MAITATIYQFKIELSDIDHHRYESLNLRLARHPSEDEERMVVRVLARTIAHEEGLNFGRGLSNVEDAALWSHLPTGEVNNWIDVGSPSAERLHRASKAARRVVVFTHKSEVTLRKEWSSRKIHSADQIEVVQIPHEMVAELAVNVPRNVTWHITLQDGLMSVASGDNNFDGSLIRRTLSSFLRGEA